MALVVLALAAVSSGAQSTFPAAAVGTAATQTVTITALTGTVASEKVVTWGQTGLDFTLPASSCVGSSPSCTETVKFTRKAPGLRLGALELFDSGGTLVGQALLSGTGNGGLAVLVPGNTLPFAGNGAASDQVNDNVSALSTYLDSPAGVAVDGAGNLYIVDTLHSRIRMVCGTSATSIIGGIGVSCTGNAGKIFTVAGGGSSTCSGYTDTFGDGCLANAAILDEPGGIALDGAGNLYIADTGFNVVREVSAVTGKISLVAGLSSGSNSCTWAEGVAPTADCLYNPQGVAVDAVGNIFIADTLHTAIRVVCEVASGEFCSGKTVGDIYSVTVSISLSDPYAIALDASGDILIADPGSNRIYEVSASTGATSTVAGNGTAGSSGDGAAATAAELNGPKGIAVDPAANLYIGDTGNNRIRKVNTLTGNISTLVPAASGEEYIQATTSTSFTGSVTVNGPQGLLVDSIGDVFFANTSNQRIWEIESNLAALDFTSTPIRQGDASAAEDQTVENDGNSTLSLTSITAGTNTAIDTTGCNATLPESLSMDAQCSIAVYFAPATTPVITANTSESGIVTADYDTTGSVTGPNSPLSIVAVGIAEPPNSTTTTVTATPNPSLYGQTVTFTVTVTTGTGSLTGTVSIYDTFGGVKTTLISGLALNTQFTTSTLAVGTHSITATYSGDTNNGGHGASTSDVLSQVVEEETSISLTTSANPSTVGQSVTFTATVTATNGGGVSLDGEVTFLDGTITLCTVAASPPINCITSALTNGVHPITAIYSGDVTKDVLGVTSAVLNQDVQAPAALTLATSGSPSYYGAAVTFTATIASSATVPASGTVNFYDTGVKIGSGTLTAANPDTATFTTSTLAVGTHPITATYAGDSYNTAATGGVSQLVAQAVTTNTVTATPNPGIAGATETLIATVTVTKGGGTPTGLVTFTSGTTVLDTANLNTSGVATITPTLAPGTYTIIASYAGDTDDATSQSAPLSLVVNQASTTTTVTPSPNPSTYLSSVTFTAVVAGNGAIPTGTVQFFASGTLIGAGTLNTSGVAVITFANLAIGSYAITAVYQGDTNDAASQSVPVSLTVDKIPTTTSLGSTTTTGSNPQVDLVATVVGSVGPVPTGTVTFSDASATLGTATLDSTGVATLLLNLPTGTYAVNAVYSGDTYHLASTSQPITVAVNPVTFTMTVSPTTMSLKTTQYGVAGLVFTSENGFADKIDLGCLGLPVGVTCTFSSPSVTLVANGSAAAQLTIDTNSPLTGGSQAMDRRTSKGGAMLAGVLLPFGVLFGWIFRRQRKRMAAVFTIALFIALSAMALVSTGCGSISKSSALPGTYTIQVVGSGTTTGVTVTQNVTLTITQ